MLLLSSLCCAVSETAVLLDKDDQHHLLDDVDADRPDVDVGEQQENEMMVQTDELDDVDSNLPSRVLHHAHPHAELDHSHDLSENRIVGGVQAKEGQFPFYVQGSVSSMLYENYYSIANYDIILTPSLCFVITRAAVRRWYGTTFC